MFEIPQGGNATYVFNGTLEDIVSNITMLTIQNSGRWKHPLIELVNKSKRNATWFVGRIQHGEAWEQKLKEAKQQRSIGNNVELIITGSLIEQRMEDPLNVTVLVDSIGPKWITGYCKELDLTTKFHTPDKIKTQLKRS